MKVSVARIVLCHLQEAVVQMWWRSQSRQACGRAHGVLQQEACSGVFLSLCLYNSVDLGRVAEVFFAESSHRTEVMGQISGNCNSCGKVAKKPE